MDILLADHQPKVRFALRVLLEQHMDYTIVAEVSEASSMLERAAALHPDLILLEWDLSSCGCDLLRRLRESCPAARLVVLSARPEVRLSVLAAGADAFVSKMEPPERLFAAIQETQDRDVS